MTAREHQQPTLEQIVQIRKLATLVIGDGGADQLFAEVGYPKTSLEASDYIGALHKIRNQRRVPDDARGAVVEHIKTTRISTFPKPEPLPEPEEGELMPEHTKECTQCGETKPLTEFHKRRSSADGHAYECKACIKKRYGKKKTPKASSPGPNEEQTGAGGGDSAPAEPSLPAPGITPPLSEHNGDWRQAFRDPRLSQLQRVQEIIDDNTGHVCDLEQLAGALAAIADVEWE